MKSIYELRQELTDEDYIQLIKPRLPVTDKEIKIVSVGVKVDSSDAFIDVPFYFELGLRYPEVLYTHLYHGKLLDYIESKQN